MAENQFKSAIANTLSNLFSAARETKVRNTLDYGGFITSIKKELIKNELPFYAVRRSDINKNIIILELPFCKECEISITPTVFGGSQKEAAIKINGILTRRIRVEQFDSAYMGQVATALVDYLKRFLIVKSKINTK